jgi:hypothetical protein
MTKYSSYKSHQLITENWRKFLAEGQEEEIDEEEEVLEEEELEEGWKEMAQGAKDTFKDITKGRKLGKTREYRKKADAERKEWEADQARVAANAARREKNSAPRSSSTSSDSDVPAWFSVPDSTKRRIARHDAEDRADKRQRDDAARRRQKVKDELGAEAWEKKQRELAADRPKSNTAYVGSGGVGSSRRYNEE